ncbi:ABC transporter ATP-binding protein [Actinoalloteichus hymeniacidonis]|uniref:ABC-type multidrug transport system, ATPase and permease component n=1 Tax=Actinoalloteichus hymeniacidonis TaxID=340345 RepID=A0AAC9MYS1_9PSEU|nr:ABC transporter ATP-binding protein [Actinoalloteichus hymeniacidonis]AOS63287.1 ABC-type multidrug transport system, ATPase and permease component [Actinoalloteichus hymeniacidonis]MBB5908674.1 putative ABC transport system ATP-binding protein [Actinoalloteichus hymeniacidonis]
MTPGGLLRRALGRHRRRLAVGVLGLSTHQAAETMVPVAIGLIIDSAVVSGDFRALALSVAALGMLFLTLNVAYRTGVRSLFGALQEETHLLRVEVAGRVLDPRGTRGDTPAGELLSVATTDAERSAGVLDVVMLAVAGSTAMVLSAVVLLSIDVPLGLGVLIGVPVLVLLLQFAAPLLTRRSGEQQAAVGRLSALATDLIRGLHALRGLGAEHSAGERYRQLSTGALRSTLRAATPIGVYRGSTTAASGLLLAAVAGFAGWYAVEGRIGIGELITVVGLAQFIAEPVQLFGYCGQTLAVARASAARLTTVLQAPHRVDAGTGDLVGPPVLRLTEVDHGSLRHLDLRAEPGEFVGVVADDPRDAEALLEVFAGRLPVEAGTAAPDSGVWLGETPLHTLRLDELRRVLLVEHHHVDLFEGSLRSTVSSGRPMATEPEVASALRAAAADEVAAAHPEGLDHVVVDRGATLSGGQRQRLGLARALVTDPPILVLHDPTTAVDAVTEETIARNLFQLRHGPEVPQPRTTIVLTSSPTLLARAHRVVSIVDGRVRLVGTHAELTAADEQYRSGVLR